MIHFQIEIMTSTYRYINNFERKKIWSLLLVQAVPFILSLYFIDHVTSDDECDRTLRQNGTFFSFYIFVPEICTWERILWLRINRYLMFSILFSAIYVQTYYELSIRYLIFVLLTTSGIFHNILRTRYKDSILHRDLPFVLMLLANVLHLEIQPFCDNTWNDEEFLIRRKNDEQRDRRHKAEQRFWNAAIDQIRTSDDDSNIRSIIRETEQQVAELEHLYPCEPLPVLPSTLRHVTDTQALVIFIIVHVLYFGLFIIAAWSYLYLIGLIFGIHLA